MNAMQTIIARLTEIIRDAETGHPVDVFALKVIVRQLEEQSHMVREGLA